MLLLPELGEDGILTGISYEDRCHTLIVWEWNQLDRDEGLVKPLYRESQEILECSFRTKLKLIN